MYVHDPNLGPYIRDHWATDAVRGASPIEDLPQVLRAERRHEARFATNEVASIHSMNPLMPECVPVQIVDVSTRGMKLRTERQIQIGAEIQIKLNRGFVLGEIRYCVQVGGFFLAGVLVDDVFWSDSGRLIT